MFVGSVCINTVMKNKTFFQVFRIVKGDQIYFFNLVNVLIPYLTTFYTFLVKNLLLSEIKSSEQN